VNTQPRILVIGDIILDKYLMLEYYKNNPESDGSVYKIVGERNHLGGAAAVALLANSLGGNVKLVGVLGEENAATRCIYRLIDANRIRSAIIERGERTTVKTRMILDDSVFPDRFDNEDCSPISNSIADKFLAEMDLYDFILISDYGKGVCSKYFLNNLPGRTSGKIIIVDPAHGADWSTYHKAALIKCNMKEAEAAFICHTIPHISEWARTLSDIYDRSVVVTCGDRGILYSQHNQTATTQFHTSGCIEALKCDIMDVCGAGDTVFAVLGVYLSRGYPLGYCCKLAVEYATQQIHSVGIRPLTLIDGTEQYAKIFQ